MHQIDDSFRRKRKQAREKQIRVLRRRIVLAGVSVVVLVVGGVTFMLWPERPVEVSEAPAAAPAEPEKPKRTVVATSIIDLAGDPLIIRLGSSGDSAGRLREMALPEELKQPTIPDKLVTLSDTMLASSQRIVPLPSSPEDFAFFQSQSGRGRQPDDIATTEMPAEPDEPIVEEALPETGEDAEVLVPMAAQDEFDGEAAAEEPLEEEGISAEDVPLEQLSQLSQPEAGMIGEAGASGEADADAGWGETVGQAPEALPGFKQTEIEDTTTVHVVKNEADRFPTIEDITVSVTGERSLESIVAEYGFSADDAKKASEAAKRLIGTDMLGERYVVGLRGFRDAGTQSAYRLAQASINSPEKYIETIALADNGEFVSGADPWIDEDLSQYSQEASAESQNVSYRLLDAIYTTATRNQVPSGITGEAIMLMSRAFDLQATTAKGDKLTIIYSPAARDEGRNAGRVLYAAIRGPDRNLECLVYQSAPGADFSCMTEKDETHSVTVANGMVNPVKGVMTSTFGPRRHPILNKVRLHKGVDWAAPIGTPIMAAFDGTIEFAGDGKGYGNVVRVNHGGGRATAYAHMSKFQDGIKVGVKVSAGDIIGYVGTTGLSTGPHLHFELYMNGVAIDPLATAVAGGGGAPNTSVDSDSDAVAKLVNRIIHVESGGNARAKNPLSSATGLGQFIKSTWLRMMRTYRPDLVKSMSTEELLALRFDPTISREMVEHLARENEASLRSRGHSITAGRLYLAHFLGPEGANIVLSASGDAQLAVILGASVITANPFLTGKDATYVIAWAEKKMSGKAPRASSSTAVATKTVVRTSPEFARYRDAMQKLAEMANAVL